MNFLIISNKAESVIYKSILQSAPNVTVLDAVNVINKKFFASMGEKWLPHAIVYDTDTNIKLKNVSSYEVVCNIHQLYPRIKIIILTHKSDNYIYPANAVIKGSISNIEFLEILDRIKKNESGISFMEKVAKISINTVQKQNKTTASSKNTNNIKNYHYRSDGATEVLSNYTLYQGYNTGAEIQPNMTTLSAKRKEKKKKEYNLFLIALIILLSLLFITGAVFILSLKSCDFSFSTPDEIPNAVTFVDDTISSETNETATLKEINTLEDKSF